MNPTHRTIQMAFTAGARPGRSIRLSVPRGVRIRQRRPQWHALLALAFAGLTLNALSSARLTAQQSEAPPSETPAAAPAPDQPTKTPAAAPAPPTEVTTEPEQHATPPAEASADDPRRYAAKVIHYAQRFIERSDKNHNGQLEREEWPAALQEKLSAADYNHDGAIQVSEYARYISEFARQRRIRLLPPQPGDLVELPPLLTPTTAESPAAADKTPASVLPPDANAAAVATKKPQRRRETQFYVSPDRFPKGLPDWFTTRDRDGDGQLTISEYSPKSVAAELQQFKQLDRDGDGVLTAAECVAPTEKKATPASKASTSP